VIIVRVSKKYIFIVGNQINTRVSVVLDKIAIGLFALSFIAFLSNNI
jgi:hypothetical protein